MGSTAAGALAAPGVGGTGRRVAWRLACRVPADPAGIDGLFARAADLLARMSAGRVALEVQPTGASAPEVAQALRDGSIDAAWLGPGEAPVALPALQLATGVPFGPDPARQRHWLGAHDTSTGFAAALAPHGLHFAVLGCHAAGVGCWSSVALDGPGELKGLRIAAQPRTLAVLEALGARPVTVDAPAAVALLRRGEIDACESFGAIEDARAGLHRLGARCLRPWLGDGTATALLWVGARTAGRRDPAARAMLEAALAQASADYFPALRLAQDAALARMAADGAVFVTTSRPVLDLAYAATQDWLATLPGADPVAAALLERWRAGRDGDARFGAGDDPLRAYMAATAIAPAA